MRFRFTSLPLLLFLLLQGAVSVHAQSVPPASAPAPSVAAQKKAATLRLMELLGMRKLSHQIMDSMFAAMKTNGPPVPDRIWDKMRAKFSDDDYLDKVAQVYVNNYTLADLNGMIAFYQTPLGQKIVATTPHVMQESMTVGMEWGRQKAMEVMQEIQKEQSGKATGASTQ